jgi:2-dehydro-3-deoxygluconokinase
MILSFGEILLRFSPRLNGEWIKDAAMPVYIGGAELNTATALAKWNVPVSYFSAAPDNYLTKEILQELQSKNINTDRLVITGNRIGTYYLPQGVDLKNAGVIYDRAHSSFSTLQKGQLDWDSILENVSWFHFSAISPALTANVAELCLEAVKAANKKGLTISIDLNYRSKLWKWGKSPVEVMPELVSYCNVVMGNIWAVETMLGIKMDENFNKEKEACLAQAQKTSEAIIKQYSNCKHVANTFRFDEGSDLRYYATLYADDALYVSKEHSTNSIIDKVGSGDCFMAGLIYGNYHRLSFQETIDYAAAAAFDKLFITGDVTTSSVDQVKSYLTAKAEGR